MASEGGSGGLLVAGHGNVVVGHSADFGDGGGGEVALELEDFEGRGNAGTEAGFAGEEARVFGRVDAFGRANDPL